MTRILVTYATKKGSTREVAEAIALRLEGHGLTTTLLPAAEIDELDGFDAVIVGGALYTGRWHADARRFLKEFREPLAGVQLAVFAIGPLTTSEEHVAGARKQLDHALEKTPEIAPVAVAIFGGVIVPDSSTSRSAACPPRMRATGRRSAPGPTRSPRRSEGRHTYLLDRRSPV